MSRKSQKALIGITTYGRQAALPFSLPSEYIDAVRAANGVPILLPPGEIEPDRILDSLDGLIISGGGDIDPLCYNGFAHPTIYSVDAERDAFELKLAEQAIEHHVPILGICRGLQILIVTCGGTLIPHIEDIYGTSTLHRLESEVGRRFPTEHLVKIEAQSLLANCIQKSHISVVSWHHQAVDIVPSGWRVIAHAPDDGVIEAVEYQHHPWAMGVQWHPELSISDSSSQRIFQALVQAAQTKRR